MNFSPKRSCTWHHHATVMYFDIAFLHLLLSNPTQQIVEMSGKWNTCSFRFIKELSKNQIIKWQCYLFDMNRGNLFRLFTSSVWAELSSSAHRTGIHCLEGRHFLLFSCRLQNTSRDQIIVQWWSIFLCLGLGIVQSVCVSVRPSIRQSINWVKPLQLSWAVGPRTPDHHTPMKHICHSPRSIPAPVLDALCISVHPSVSPSI